MIVVVDTNVFHGDPRMQKRNFRVLVGQHERGRYVLKLPEVVVREIPKMYRREYEGALSKLAAGARKLSELGHDPTPGKTPTADDAHDTYAQWLREHLKQRKIEVAPLPGIDLSELVDQAVAERRPFQAGSKGFRDAVIWRTVRELAKDDEVVLVSENWRDFAESEKRQDQLHRHLQEDLREADLATDRVTLVASLEEFIDRYVPREEQHLLMARQLLEEDKDWAGRLYERLTAELYRLDVGHSDAVTVVESANAAVENVAVEDVMIDGVTVGRSYETEDDDVVSLELYVQAVVTFSFTVETGEAEWLLEEKADVQIDIWEESFAQGSTMGRHIEVTYAVDFNVGTREIENFEKVHAVDDPLVPGQSTDPREA